MKERGAAPVEGREGAGGSAEGNGDAEGLGRPLGRREGIVEADGAFWRRVGGKRACRPGGGGGGRARGSARPLVWGQ